MSLTLYYHPLSSYCHKALVALYENGVAFDKRLIDFGNEQDRAELLAIWPIGKFPVIRDHARRQDVAESSIIIEYLDHHYPGKSKLLPGNFDTALQVRAWDRFFDHYVHTPVQEIVNDRIRQANGDMGSQRSRLQTAYQMIDKQLGTKPWIASDEFTMADCAAVPSLFYAATLVPIPSELTLLSAYFERLMSRPSSQRVLEEAKPYLSMYPFADLIPARFR